jgi:D-alanine-D-alanine ligase
MRILLIGGGWSNEREVSLNGVRAIHEALQQLGHQVELFDPAESFSELPYRAAASDFAFINLHGAPGEDGLIQAILEQTGCPYQGTGPAGSMLALNKAAAKAIFKRSGVPTPRWEFLPLPPEEGWRPSLEYPFFAKPNSGGSSLDVTRIENEKELQTFMERLFAQGEEILLEEMIAGQEITCAVLGTDPLPPILIEPADSSAFFDYYSKYTPQAAKEICPAPVSEELTAAVQSLAATCHTSLGLSGYSRTDFIVRDEEPFALEVNTLPGMTSTSLLPQSAGAAGYSFKDLIAKLIELGFQT